MSRALAAAAAAAALTIALFALAPDTLWMWDARTSDLLFQYRLRLQPASSPSPVVHVDISDSSLTEMGTSEVTRAELGRVVRTLSAAGARIVALDFVFPGRDEAFDRDLIDALAGSAAVIVGDAPNLRFEASDAAAGAHLTQWRLRLDGPPGRIPAAAPGFSTFDELRRAAAGAGFLNLAADPDGVYRRAPLLLRAGDGFVPSLALSVAAAALDVAPDRITVFPGRFIELIAARRPDGSRSDLRIPIDDQARLRINYRVGWEDQVHLRFVDLLNAPPDGLEADLWRRELNNRVVLIADTSTGAGDSGPAPIDRRLPLVGVHGAVLTSLLTGEFVYEPSPAVRVASAMLAILTAFSAAVLIRSYWYLVAIALLMCGYGVVTVMIFTHGGWMLPTLPPLIGVAAFTGLVTGLRYADEQRTRATLRRSFESYFAPRVVEKILENPAAILDNVEYKTLSILFSDIEGFTLRSAAMPPGEVRAFLNGYFGEMVQVVFAFGGTVDKFIGDGLMVFFGDPLPQDDHARRAVDCAIAMQRRVTTVNEQFAAAGRAPIRIRVGIATGEVVVGNMGSDARLSYTVLGATVNLAQRLESHAPPGGVLMSEQTHNALPETYGTRARPPLMVKGVPHAMTVFEIPADAVSGRSVLPP